MVGGEHNLVVPSLHEQIRGVDSIILHPNYTHSDASIGGMATPLTNDLALVKLKSPMKESEYVQVISLPPSPPSPGLDCVTAGWGTQSVNSLVMTSVLQKTPAPLVPKEECEEAYTACSTCPPISDDAFCTGGTENGPCFGYMWGDSGGPLVCDTALYGIVSWGVGCEESGLPWVNTQVGDHLTWIL